MATPAKTDAQRIEADSQNAILNEIASSALQIASLVQRAIDNVDEPEVVDLLCSSAEVLARRIGWMAEVANEQLGERVGVMGTDARDWLMPPLYRRPAGEG